MSAIHFRTPRQDKWTDEDGPVNIDALYIAANRWAIAYCESESGTVKLPNNRFNVQAVGYLPFIPGQFSRLSRDTCQWLLERWSCNDKVWLIRVPTAVLEAPYRFALTTLSNEMDWRSRERELDGSWKAYYEAAGSLALRDSWRKPPRTKFLYELGFAHGGTRHGLLNESPSSPLCDAMNVRDTSEIEFLEQELDYWKKRAENIASEDHRSRYERVGTYAMLPRPLDRGLAGSPWKIEAFPDQLKISKRRKWQPTLHASLKIRAGATTISWSSEFQSLPLLGAHTGSGCSLIVWRYKDQITGGQAVVTDGESYWLFQAIASRIPIRKGSKASATKKISQPTIVGHLQRAPTYWREDKSKLREKLQRLAEFVPSPFSEMSKEKLADYCSSYRQGRANVLAIGGPPASGKTFIVKQLISRADDWVLSRKERLLDCMYSEKLNLYVFGKYEPEGGIFQGTDKLSMAVQANAETFLAAVAATPVNVVFEGDRLFNRKFLEKAVALDTNLAILRFQVAQAIKAERHLARRDSQTAKYQRSRETKVDNICQSPILWDCVEEVRNENAADNKRILRMIDWFLSPRVVRSKGFGKA
jgi:hypothetical protein